MLDPNSLSVDAFREESWRVVAPRFQARIDSLLGAFAAGRARALGSADRSDVAVAAVEGRVQTLLVEAECCVPGRVDEATRRLLPGDEADPEVDDLLDDIAEIVLAKGGEVLYVARESMPEDSGLAAIYRF